MKIYERPFGEKAKLYTVVNDNGFQISFTDFGARIVSLEVPIENENNRQIVLGFDSAEEYLEKECYIGATIGRVAGRIFNGQFTVKGKDYQVCVQSETGHCLHGGPSSFEEKYWSVEIDEYDTSVSLVFSYFSPDGENGFPGNLEIKVTHSFNNDNQWQVSYWAKTDQDTLFNPTNHVYFNLLGDMTANLDEHRLMVAADEFAAIDSDINTTGKKQKVEGTAFDFRKAQILSKIFHSRDEQKKLVDGIDHPFILNKDCSPCIALEAPDKKVTLEVETTEQSVVIFTSNFVTPIIMHKKELAFHGGITFETQALPGSERFSDFGSIVLEKNKTYYSSTQYKIIT